ncbi:MAG TPA: c-type cytochrome [Xanthobacteraceae bacterium]|jgi:cytochrome c553|nr:c-type cytochrome [Xanthobacteraceae bacterium]HQS45429.1 c-type cytochrome [Xanthobacteraceae bacterium]
MGEARRPLIAVALAGALLGSGLLLVAVTGAYNIAASEGHWRITEILLRFGLERSVSVRANETPPRLDDPDLIRLGAGHFHAACAPCHGAPGTPVPAFVGGMLPTPPDLRTRVDAWSDAELFRIIRHGIKYTGMPAWPSRGTEREIWAVTAFVRHMHRLDAAAYQALARGGATMSAADGTASGSGRNLPDGVAACAHCHGAQGQQPSSALVPTLYGQPEAMLRAALRSYAQRTRPSGVMQVAVDGLSPRQLDQLAAYYAAIAPPVPQPPTPDQMPLVEAGRVLAEHGDAAARIPACLSCHGPQALPLYPRLAGQSARYLEGRLDGWRHGAQARGDALDRVMAPIARRLSEEQARALAAFFAQQAPHAAQARADGL